jgi:predicted transcriptional regulator
VDLDVNIESHDLLWRLMEPSMKKRYRESFGATQAQIVDSEMAKLIKSGLVVEKDSRYELTPKGRSLYNLLAKKKGCCQPT